MRTICCPIIFDTDCLSSFSWIQRLDILNNLFPNSIIIPEPVLNELSKMRSYSYFSYVFNDVDNQIKLGNFRVEIIPALSEMSSEYLDLISPTSAKPIGRGEASAIVLAKYLDGTLASNNLKDILPIVSCENPPIITTEIILYEYYSQGGMTESEGEALWKEMKLKKRKLPSYDF